MLSRSLADTSPGAEVIITGTVSTTKGKGYSPLKIDVLFVCEQISCLLAHTFSWRAYKDTQPYISFLRSCQGIPDTSLKRSGHNPESQFFCRQGNSIDAFVHLDIAANKGFLCPHVH